MRVVVIGATGHVGGYLVPRLVDAGHEVTAISRGQRDPYRDDPAWAQVTRVTADRDAEDAAGTFGPRIAALRADLSVVAQWGLVEVLPVRWTGPSLNPDQPGVATEELEIAHHGFTDAGGR